jgi:CO dehydrogenase/acetyl-CoA synthase gamma subunit (corrinoid Fe-S protein)
MNYFISYQGSDQKPVMYVATDDTLSQTVKLALEQSNGSPVLISEAKTV